MKIGITYDLKAEIAQIAQDAEEESLPGVPDDLHEEFDSPKTIDSIAEVLRGLGHDIVKLGDGRELLERLLADPPDFVFNFAEGQGVGRAREARVPAVLEMLGIPYTGSDPLTLAVTLDKDCAKRLVASEGIAVPPGLVVRPGETIEGDSGLTFPVLIKPAWEGSSKGIRNHCLVEEPDRLAESVDALLRDYRQPVLIEEFIQGDELTVGLLGNDPPRVLGVMRVVPNEAPRHFVYSLEVKRDFRRQVRYECPARLPRSILAKIEEAALRSFQALGCRDVARVDFRLRDGIPYFLEVNPLPGLNPESSDLVILANLVGWDHARLIETILQSALERTESVRDFVAARF